MLKHTPTGISIEGIIPSGHYSKARFRELQEQLRVRLLPELEDLVAQKLRIPGR